MVKLEMTDTDVGIVDRFPLYIERYSWFLGVEINLTKS